MSDITPSPVGSTRGMLSGNPPGSMTGLMIAVSVAVAKFWPDWAGVKISGATVHVVVLIFDAEDHVDQRASYRAD